MLSKIFSKTILLIILSLVVSCQQDRVERHNAVLPENLSEPIELKKNPSAVETNRQGTVYNRIVNLIEEGTDSSLVSALQDVQKLLLNGAESGPEVYTNAVYAGYLHLYVRLYHKAQNTQGTTFNDHFLQSSLKFKEVFVDPCINPNLNLCELLRQSLKQEAQLTPLILDFARAEQNLKLKLKIIGFTYDLVGRRGDQQLNELYLEAVLDAIDEKRKNSAVDGLTNRELQQHSLNISVLIQQLDWSSGNDSLQALFKKIEPWSYNKTNPSVLNQVRPLLIAYLPLYLRKDAAVGESVQTALHKQLSELDASQVEMKNHPSYSDINLMKLSMYRTDALYLAYNLYFQNLSITSANQFVEATMGRSAFIDDVYKIIQELIRWDIAQLSIWSTKQLREKFFEQEIKTAIFVQQTMDWGKTLVPMWTELHSVRLWSVGAFLNAQIRHSSQYNEIDIQNFFNAINRNILKTVVYPNMFAFAYYMSKSEWKQRIRFYWFTFDIDTTTLFEYLLNGQYLAPWFNFTNLKQDKGTSLYTKASLFRSEILDALHFFFSTKTNEVYGIEADSFFKVIFETVMKKRQNLFERAYDIQRQIYFVENSSASQLMNWCVGVEQGAPVEENISFYDLSLKLIPYADLTLSTDPYNTNGNFYFADHYKELSLGVNTINDRIRLELVPINNYFARYINLYNRLAPELSREPLGPGSDSVTLLQKYKNFERRFIGQQFYLADKLNNCLFLSANESTRRAMAIASAQRGYVSHIVHPILSKLKSGVISLDEAKGIISEYHNNHQGFLDDIYIKANGEPVYVLSEMGFMLRVRMWLMAGRNFFSEHTEQFNIPPIVGPHLQISIPSNVLSQEKNPYIGKISGGDHLRELMYNENKDEFSDAGVRLVTDGSRLSIYLSEHFTGWDRRINTAVTMNFANQMEYMVQMLQMGKVEYLDYDQAECLSDEIQVKDTCIKTREYSLDDLAGLMEKIYDYYRLDSNETNYLKLINAVSFAGSDAMKTVLKLDQSVRYDIMTNTYPYKELAGVFDAAYHMLKADYLGSSYNSEWEGYISQGGSDKVDQTCEGRRDGCYWKNEKQQAFEFFLSRAKRPGMIFKFDLEVVKEDYKFVGDRVVGKLQRLVDLENRSSELLSKFSFSEESIAYHMYRPAEHLTPLRTSFLSNQRDFDKYLKDELESYFLQEPSWSDYLIVQ